MGKVDKYLTKLEKLVSLLFKRDPLKKSQYIKKLYSGRYAPGYIAKMFKSKFGGGDWTLATGNILGLLMVEKAEGVLGEDKKDWREA